MGKTILIIDDDPNVLEILEEVLIYSNFTVKGMQGTNDILKAINDYKADLVLMDYILNGINGGELCHQIKANVKTAHIPVVLISAYPRVLQSLGAYGCDLFIPKPFNITDLVNNINDCFMQKA
jgi:DNA-binding response OmpR family regulator